jgi:hypothetical protein
MAVVYSYGAAPTYVKVASQTLTGSTALVTFSNIPQGYTDLVVSIAIAGLSAAETPRMYFNGDTTSLYTTTFLDANGTSVLNNRTASQSSFYGIGAYNSGNPTGASNIIVYLNNYSNTVTNKTMLARNASSLSTTLTAGLYRSTAPISSISFFVHPGSNTYSTGTVFTVYGIKAAIGAPKAIGGDSITTDGTYWYHAFRNTGAFKPSQAITADVLQIAGGGPGVVDDVQFWAGGGGGAGGVSYVASQSLTANTSYTATVGGGGVFDWSWPSATKGSNSQFGSLTAAVGGGAAIGNYSALGQGGSGGGATARINTSGGTGTSGQGNAGGATAAHSGGGGGGAGGAGGTVSTDPNGGTGGVGTSTYSSWGAATNTGQLVSGVTYFAGGGGGGAVPYYGSVTIAQGGSGGGGAGSVGGIGNKGISGLSNTGGGGGGGGGVSTAGSGAGPGGNGGSGIIIVRYTV